MTIAALAGQRVAVWGFGREGRAAIAALRTRLPTLPLTLYCAAEEMSAAQAFDGALTVRAGEPDAAALDEFDVVIKSPGISAYKPALLAARAQGVRITSGTALWFAENPAARVIAVTGTKGKSTTSALLTHLARAVGVRTALAGNIGLPLLELLDQSAALWVIELSSFQTGEAGPLALGVVTSLYEEHLDWHGSRERYVTDKLRLAEVAQRLLVNAGQADLLARTVQHPDRLTFGRLDGWHVADGFIRRGERAVFALGAMTAPGEHNALNACAALAALEAMGIDAIGAAPALASFRPLPHRLQPLGQRDGFHYINDSISTTPQATLAALDSLSGQAVGVLVGGYERGLDWTPFVTAMTQRPPQAIVCMGANGARIETALRAAGVACAIARVDGLAEALTRAQALLTVGGTVLLSPGAPSFDQFHDYAERGRRFAELAGFDNLSAGIDGMGIA
jgi:UDP-N-acetylmuramoylalanine--D-glutamate ligase